MKKQDTWEGLFWRQHKYNERVKIKSGTYLKSYCPYCSKELTKDSKLILEFLSPQDRIGQIELSPYLNVFEHRTDLNLQEGTELSDLRCPLCHTSLVITEKKCARCKSNVASILIGSTTLRVPFYICMRLGCHWHSLSPEREKRIMLEESDEW